MEQREFTKNRRTHTTTPGRNTSDEERKGRERRLRGKSEFKKRKVGRICVAK